MYVNIKMYLFQKVHFYVLSPEHTWMCFQNNIHLDEHVRKMSAWLGPRTNCI